MEEINNNASETPWVKLKDIIQSENREELENFLDQLGSQETARAISRLSQEYQTKLITLLDPEDAADILSEVTDEQAIDLIEDLDPKQAASIVEEMYSDDQADLLSNLDPESSEAILEHLDHEDAQEIRELMTYPENVAGGLMITEYLEYAEALTVKEVLKDFYENGDEYSYYEIQYVYVVDDKGRLVGVSRFKDLLIENRGRTLGECMTPNPISFNVQTPLEKLIDFFDTHDFVGVPVIDDAGHLLGIIKSEAVQDAALERAEETYLKASGIIGGEELRTMPVLQRTYTRFVWLALNIALNIMAVSVIAIHQDTLEQVITLTVFMPVIAALSGCSGNQAVAVSIRELSLGLITAKEHFRVMRQEAVVGLLNGLTLGLIIGAMAWIWKGNIYLGIVLMTALSLNIIIGAVMGGVIPLFFKRFNVDPAISSGPVLNSITDMCGFLLTLTLAQMFLSKLVS